MTASTVDTSTYVAFRSSEILHTTTDGFIRRMNEGATRPDPHTIEAIMTRFLDEAIEAFFIVPSDLLGLSPNMKRVVHVTADTISKATHMVVKRTAKKLDIEQNRNAAVYMDLMRLMVPDQDGNEVWYVSFPISDGMAKRARTCIDLCLEGQTKQALPLFLEYLHELVDVAMHWYFEEPMKLMGFGPIMRKIVDVAVVTTRKATHSLINKVVANLDHEQLIEAARYMDSLLVVGPTQPTD